MAVHEQHEGTLEEEDPPDNSKVNTYYEEQKARKKAILTFCKGGGKRYCFAREFLNHAKREYDTEHCIYHNDDEMCSNQQRIYEGHWSIRTLMQMKGMIEERYLASQTEGRDIGSNDAAIRWMKEGKGKAFREKYDKCQLDTHHVLESTVK